MKKKKAKVPVVHTQMSMEEEYEHIEEAYRERSQRDCLTFLRGLKIPSDKGARLFDSCMAPFQRKCFDDLMPSLDAIQEGDVPPIRRFWIERTKKASKDGDIGAILLWLCAFPRRSLYLQVGAADKDQAAIIKRRITDLLFYNPWLGDYVADHAYKIRHKGNLAEIDIVAADIAGSHGETPAVLVVNELSHVTKWEFVENLMDNADGVANGLAIVATNAGFKGTKAAIWRDNAIKSTKVWRVHLLQQPAPWMSMESVEDAKQRNPTSRFNRLWYGKWASGKGDALSEDDIDKAFCLKGPLRKRNRGKQYIAGLDLGVSHDHAGFAILEIDEKLQSIRLAWFKAWEPNPKTGEVDLIDVEDSVFAQCKHFGVEMVGYDPSQAKLMAQRLTRKRVFMKEVVFTGKNLTLMADTLVQVLESGKLLCYDDEDGRLRRDFGKFNIVEKPYGYRLEAVSDEHGHADVGTALVIALPFAVMMLAGRLNLDPDDMLAYDDDVELTKEEVEEMPADLRDIYEAGPDEELDLDESDEIFVP